MKLTVDGIETNVATGGVDPVPRLSPAGDQGAEPVVLLVHGAGMDSTVWQLQTRWLAHHGCVPLAVDLPGHGRSEGEPLTSIEAMADWLGRLVEQLGAAGGSVAVVGHSMGTFVGLELAARRPELVSQLVLLGTADAMGVHPQLLADAVVDIPAAAALMAAWSHAKPAHIGHNPTPGQWMLGGARALVEMSASGALATDFNACAGYDRAPIAAADVRCPVAVGIGRGDKMTPPSAAATLVDALVTGGCEVDVTTLDNAGHMMMVENPGAIRRLLQKSLTATT